MPLRGGLLELAATPLKVVCSISVPEDIELGPESQSGPIHHGTAMGGLRLYPKRNGRKQAWLAAKGGPEEYTVMEERLWTTAGEQDPSGGMDIPSWASRSHRDPRCQHH